MLNPIGRGVAHGLTKARRARGFGSCEFGFDRSDIVVCDRDFKDACCAIKHQTKADVCGKFIEEVSDGIIPRFVVADRTGLVEQEENIGLLISTAILRLCAFLPPNKNDQGQQPRCQGSPDACPQKARNGSLCTHENSLQTTHENDGYNVIKPF